jgi:mannan endo-1,6-alpha-mannosidase
MYVSLTSNKTGSDLWRNRVRGIITGLNVFFEDDVMIEVTCEIEGTCNIDQRSFKAYLSRWMGYTAIVAPWTRDSINPRLQASAMAAAAQCTGGESQTDCNLYWATKDERVNSFGVGEQMAAVEVIQSLLYPFVAGPASRNSGGTSLSRPNAGLDTASEPRLLNNSTVGDKIGVAFLTVIMLVSTITGAVWMLSERDEPNSRQE